MGIATHGRNKATNKQRKPSCKTRDIRTSAPSQLLAHASPWQLSPHCPIVTWGNARLVNREKHPMRVLTLSAYRSVERGWATNQKGRDVSVVERGWAGNSKGWGGWWVAHVSNFTARNINASDHYVAALTQQSSKYKPCSLRCGLLKEADSER